MKNSSKFNTENNKLNLALFYQIFTKFTKKVLKHVLKNDI